MADEEEVKAFVDSLIAAEDTALAQNDGNTFWVVFAGVLVFFMHAGFAMLEVGSVQAKNRVNILFKNIGTVTFGGISYFLIGYGLAYGTYDGKDQAGISFIGAGSFSGKGFDDGEAYGLRTAWFFQYAFCVTSATIVSGAVTGRIKLEAYFLIAIYLTAIVYPVVSHWVWSTHGFLSAFLNADLYTPEDFFLGGVYEHACGVIDYAGSGVVHMTGGVAAFWVATILGPRYGRFGAGKGEVTPMPPQNLSMMTLGTFILWFGWFGFNCGSALLLDGVNASKVAVTTALAPAAGCVTAIIVQKYRTGKYDLSTALNSVLGGLVAITAGCSTVEDWAAIPIGAIGSLVYIWSSELLLKLKIDDPVGASPVHGFCGIWGVLSIGIFSSPFYVQQAYSCPNPPPSNGEYWEPLPGYQFIAQIVLVLSIIGWVTLTVVPFVYGLRKAGILRVPDHEQEIGLDATEHQKQGPNVLEAKMGGSPMDIEEQI